MRHDSKTIFRFALALMCLIISSANAEEMIQERQPQKIHRVVAIDDVCAWPNLTKMPDDRLVATLFNQPCHGSCAGDVDCWESLDGTTWKFLGRPAPHEPETNRMNVAAGLAANGDLIVLSSGWSGVQTLGVSKSPTLPRNVLDVWVCRSTDGGKTWSHTATFASAPEGYHPLIPFGDIQIAEDGTLRVAAYSTMIGVPHGSPDSALKSGVWMVRSDDDGRNWTRMPEIAKGGNETSLLCLGHQKWLAAVRTVQSTMDLYRSGDDGKTWTKQGPLSGLQELNGHLLKLKDGRLLYTYGNRVPGKNGVLAKFSPDDGEHWSAPLRLVDVLPFDCGYPSSAQLADGNIVTIWYAMKSKDHPRYHMGAATWTPTTRE
jgi:hypothetical protein